MHGSWAAEEEDVSGPIVALRNIGQAGALGAEVRRTTTANDALSKNSAVGTRIGAESLLSPPM